jgi:hypothetical protein
MAAEFVTRWLEEKKPDARVTHLGVDEDDVHVWDLEFPDQQHVFRLGIHDSVVEDEGVLAERLMEVDTQGWLDDAGEKDLWVLVATTDISEGLSLFGKSKPARADRPRSRSTRASG